MNGSYRVGVCLQRWPQHLSPELLRLGDIFVSMDDFQLVVRVRAVYNKSLVTVIRFLYSSDKKFGDSVCLKKQAKKKHGI